MKNSDGQMKKIKGQNCSTEHRNDLVRNDLVDFEKDPLFSLRESWQSITNLISIVMSFFSQLRIGEVSWNIFSFPKTSHSSLTMVNQNTLLLITVLLKLMINKNAFQ